MVPYRTEEGITTNGLSYYSIVFETGVTVDPEVYKTRSDICSRIENFLHFREMCQIHLIPGYTPMAILVINNAKAYILYRMKNPPPGVVVVKDYVIMIAEFRPTGDRSFEIVFNTTKIIPFRNPERFDKPNDEMLGLIARYNDHIAPPFSKVFSYIQIPPERKGD